MTLKAEHKLPIWPTLCQPNIQTKYIYSQYKPDKA